MNSAMLIDIAKTIVPQQVAVVDDQTSWTYEELWQQSCNIATHLKDIINVNDVVGIMLTNRVEYVATIIGCWLAGAVAQPINNRLKRQELEPICRNVRVVVTEQRYASLLHCQILRVEHIQASTMQWQLQAQRTAFILLTSGTTSAPKEVEIFHEIFADYIMQHNDAPGGSAAEVYLNHVPLFHITGLTAVFNALYSGKTVVLREGFDACDWLAAVERYQVTHTFVVPTMLFHIIQQPNVQKRCESLMQITYGGAPMPYRVIRQALDTLPQHIAFSNAFGLTETMATIAVLSPEDHQLLGTAEQITVKEQRLKSVGRVVADVELRIRNGATICRAFEEGVIEVRTARLNHYRAHQKTEWLTTHDTGYFDEERYLFLTGRSAEIIVRGGENIAPLEIEAQLLQHPAIEQVAVVGVESEQWGQEVAAAIVGDKELLAEEIIIYAKQFLASFKIPAHYVFVDELPLSATGKVDKRRIQRIIYDKKGKTIKDAE